MGITIHYYAKEDATKKAQPIAPTPSDARKKFFTAIEHVEARARDLGWKFLGIDVTPKNAKDYRDKNGRPLCSQNYGGNTIEYFWLPAAGSEMFGVGINLDTGAFVGGFTKTQYIKKNRLQRHIEVCEVLMEINKIFGGVIDISDEADYLPGRNIDAAGKNFGESDAMIASLGKALKAQLGDQNVITGADLADAA